MQRASVLRRIAKKGFTLIELMIVVAIIGILAAIAIPKFADLVRKSSEGATKGNLGALRATLSIYYGDMEGGYPRDDISVLVLAGKKYIESIPTSKTPNYHPDSAVVVTITSNSPSNFTENGGWAYVNNPGVSEWGSLWVNCTHTDSKGTIWTAY